MELSVRLIRTLLTLLLLVAVFSVVVAVVAEFGLLEPETVPSEIPDGSTRATVEWVYDGDTISVLLENGDKERVRLVGLDAPETGGNNTTVQCYGAESTQYLRSLLPVGTTVWLERDVSDRDQYGRLLRFVWTSRDGEAVLVNHAILEDGFAFARTYGNDRSRADLFRETASSARDQNLGMWAACPAYRG
jgi:micrococcal nuclease